MIFNRMKSLTCSLLIIILLQLMIPVNTESTLDYIVEQKIKKLLQHTDGFFSTKTTTLSCTTNKAIGYQASCPIGMTATGCSCGFACGSWEIHNENTCRCLCAIIDWTSARCCHLV